MTGCGQKRSPRCILDSTIHKSLFSFPCYRGDGTPEHRVLQPLRPAKPLSKHRFTHLPQGGSHPDPGRQLGTGSILTEGLIIYLYSRKMDPHAWLKPLWLKCKPSLLMVTRLILRVNGDLLNKIMIITIIVEWVALPFSRGFSQPKDQTHISYLSCTDRWALYYLYHLRSPFLWPYHPKCTWSCLISEAKQDWAWLVLGMGDCLGISGAIGLGFPGGSESKQSACNRPEDQQKTCRRPGLIPGWGRSPGEGNGNPL